MQDHRVAKRYSAALFSVAKRAQSVDNVGSDLATFVQLLQDNPKFRSFLLSPEVEKTQKASLIDNVFGDRLSSTTLHLLKLILEKKREAEIFSIQFEYEELRREANRAVAVTIETAFETTDSEQAQLLKKAEVLSGKRVEATFAVNPQLIGGVRLLFENVIYDATLQGQLQKLQGRLTYDLSHQTN